MSKITFHLTTLGCVKNGVDSDSMAQLLEQDGYHSVQKAKRADVLIVNTCGFIQAARDESIAELQELARGKRPGQLLIAAGCLTQRYAEEVARRVPGVDGILGTRRWMDIVDVVRSLRGRNQTAMKGGMYPEPLYHLPDTAIIGADPVDGEGHPATVRALVTGASAYLKIADGCRRPCAFCSIPLIKGTLVSRPMEMILEEASALAEAGVRELILVAQDTTDYGHDLGLRDGLAVLLENLVVVAPQVDWIRILYAYPGYVTDRLMAVMAAHPQVLPYLDIPLQHAHPATLQRMGRPANMEWVTRTIARMRATFPGLALRTTFIVGYPGETEEEFQALLDFMQQVRFDRVGTFQFSFEPGTPSAPLGDPVPAEVKQERYDRLMELQQGISLQIGQSFVGKTLDVLVEGRDNGISFGRSYRDAPEIDGLVIVHADLEAGSLLPVKITGALAYDLEGIPAG